MKSSFILKSLIMASFVLTSLPAIAMESSESSEESVGTKKKRKKEEKREEKRRADEFFQDYERIKKEKHQRLHAQYQRAEALTLIEETRRKEQDEFSAQMSKRNEEIERQKREDLQREVDEQNRATSELVRYRLEHPELWHVLKIPPYSYQKK